MGMSFTNLHIRKTADLNISDLTEMLKKEMHDKGYVSLDRDEDSDICVVLYHAADSQWITIASDSFQFSNAEDTKAAAEPYSMRFGTDVIAVACFDSDYLMLHLLNTADRTDGWINVGDNYGMPFPRRTSLAPWKKITSDFERFKSLMKEDHVCAESALFGAAELLGMNPDQCCLDAGDVSQIENTNLVTMYFRMPEGQGKELPVFQIPRFDLMPCRIGESKCVFVNNHGGRSKGIAVQFQGKYIQNDDLTFENVTFEYKQGEKYIQIPIELKKICVQSGEAILYWCDKDFQIPPAVNPAIPQIKRMKIEFQKEFGIRFTVCGNPRKALDVKVFLIPLENRKGSACWYVYKYEGSKRNYIEHQNKGLNYHEIPAEQRSPFMLNPDEYDLDD